MSVKENPGSALGISSGQGRGENNKSSGFTIRTPSISLLKGGGVFIGVGEKFTASPAADHGSITIPITISLGRSCLGPQLSLSHDFHQIYT